MICFPAVTVHGLPQALAALGPGRPVALLSGPGAGAYAGCGWWRALVEAARAAFPRTPAADILDCGDQAGRAMAALRAGQRLLVLDPSLAAVGAVVGAAAECGAVVLIRRPPSINLAVPGAARGLARWLG